MSHGSYTAGDFQLRRLLWDVSTINSGTSSLSIGLSLVTVRLQEPVTMPAMSTTG